MADDPALDALRKVAEAHTDHALNVVSGGELTQEGFQEYMQALSDFAPHAAEILKRIED